MKAQRDALLDALDALDAPVCFFVRDDDAGWADERLFALLDCTARAGVPIDLAAIPTATGRPLARELLARMRASDGRIGVHQHGFAHLDHEAPARKCEFGAARGLAAQRRDLAEGRDRLRDLFGADLDPIFTPPWNRCAPGTPALLAELGFARLSRDVTAPAQHDLPELPVHVDWCKEQRLARERGENVTERVAHALAAHVRRGAAVGLMLHHAPMGDDELAALEAAWARWTRHPQAQWRRMNDLPAALRAPARISEESTT